VICTAVAGMALAAIASQMKSSTSLNHAFRGGTECSAMKASGNDVVSARRAVTTAPTEDVWTVHEKSEGFDEYFSGMQQVAPKNDKTKQAELDLKPKYAEYSGSKTSGMQVLMAGRCAESQQPKPKVTGYMGFNMPEEYADQLERIS